MSKPWNGFDVLVIGLACIKSGQPLDFYLATAQLPTRLIEAGDKSFGVSTPLGGATIEVQGQTTVRVTATGGMGYAYISSIIGF